MVGKLPEIRKIIKLGKGYVISIPSKWLKYQEEKSGSKIDQILLEINGELKIKPYAEKGDRK